MQEISYRVRYKDPASKLGFFAEFSTLDAASVKADELRASGHVDVSVVQCVLSENELDNQDTPYNDRWQYVGAFIVGVLLGTMLAIGV